MRPILPPDLDLLTRVALPLPVEHRAGAIAQILSAADLADRYRKRTGRLHPLHGDGSVLSVALQHRPSAVGPFCDARYCTALATVLLAVSDWRNRTQTLRIS